MRELRLYFFTALLGVAAAGGCTRDGADHSNTNPLSGQKIDATLGNPACRELVVSVSSGMSSDDGRGATLADEYCNDDPGDPGACEQETRLACAELGLDEEGCARLIAEKCDGDPGDPGCDPSRDPNCDPIPTPCDPANDPSCDPGTDPGGDPQECIDLVWAVCVELGGDEETCKRLIEEHCFGVDPTDPPPDPCPQPEPDPACFDEVERVCLENGLSDDECKALIEERCFGGANGGGECPPPPPPPDPEPEPSCIDEALRECAESGLSDEECRQLIADKCNGGDPGCG